MREAGSVVHGNRELIGQAIANLRRQRLEIRRARAGARSRAARRRRGPAVSADRDR